MEERTLPIKHESHETSFLQVAVFDIALAFAELLMSTGLARPRGKKQGTTKTLGAIAIVRAAVAAYANVQLRSKAISKHHSARMVA